MKPTTERSLSDVEEISEEAQAHAMSAPLAGIARDGLSKSVSPEDKEEK
jgi:hypothetical protein